MFRRQIRWTVHRSTHRFLNYVDMLRKRFRKQEICCVTAADLGTNRQSNAREKERGREPKHSNRVLFKARRTFLSHTCFRFPPSACLLASGLMYKYIYINRGKSWLLLLQNSCWFPKKYAEAKLSPLMIF